MKKSALIGIIVGAVLLATVVGLVVGLTVSNHTTETTTTAQQSGSSVAYMSNMSIYHQDDGYYRFLFSLQDEEKNYLKVGATVKIRIVNDLGVEVYKKSITVTENDFDEWENRYYGTSWIAAAIYIDESYIKAGVVDAGTFYYQITTSEGSRFNEYSLDIDGLPIKQSVYDFNETWVINGEWELTILSAEVHNGCVLGSEYEQYVLITYKYKNLNDTNEMAFTEHHLKVYDSDGNLATSCYSCNHYKYAVYVDPGASNTASMLYGFNSATDTIKIVASNYDENHNTIKATFNGSITTNSNNNNNSGTNNSGTNNSGTNNSGTNNSGTNNSGTNNSGTNNNNTNNDSNGNQNQGSNTIKTYSLGKKWIVDGQWEFSIKSVTTHYLCNTYANNANGYTTEKVVIISYTYKNIGYNDKLWFHGMTNMDAFDDEGISIDTYSCAHTVGMDECYKGTTGSSKQAFVVETDSDYMTIYVSKDTESETEDSEELVAKFIIPLN